MNFSVSEVKRILVIINRGRRRKRNLMEGRRTMKKASRIVT